MSPLITVITLSFNSQYLFESILSVLNQSYENIQYLIVDDGSIRFDKNKVCTYLEYYKKSNIREYEVISNERNLGTVKAFNIALKKAKGEYIFNLAADDLFYDSLVLEEWVSEFLKRQAVFMLGRIAIYDPSLKTFKEFFPKAHEAKLLKEGNFQKIFAALSKQNFIIGCGTARSRKLLQLCGYFDEEYFLLEDYPYALKAIRNHIKIEYWERPVIQYRLGGISSPQNFNNVYEKDSDLNFKKEILPYTNFPFLTKFRYFLWKSDRIERGKFTTAYQKLLLSHKFYLLPLLIFRFPIPILRGIKNKLWQKLVKHYKSANER